MVSSSATTVAVYLKSLPKERSEIIASVPPEATIARYGTVKGIRKKA